jgi:hypothetical protein
LGLNDVPLKTSSIQRKENIALSKGISLQLSCFIQQLFTRNQNSDDDQISIKRSQNIV